MLKISAQKQADLQWLHDLRQISTNVIRTRLNISERGNICTVKLMNLKGTERECWNMV
jgi:hypothetical protein